MATKPRRPDRGGDSSGHGDRRGERRGEAHGERSWSGHDVFTTGEAAEICNVSQQTIIRCFDSGRLRGFRVPGSRFRRIPRAELIRFMKSNGIAVTALDGDGRRVLLMSPDSAFADSLVEAVGADERLDLCVATTAYDGGLLTAQFSPHVIVVDIDLPQLDPTAVLRRLHDARTPAGSAPVEAEGMQVVFIGAALRAESIAQLTELGAAACLRKPVDAPGLVRRISGLI